MIFRFVSYAAMCQGHEYLEIFISEGQYKKENCSKEILERIAMFYLSNFTLEKVLVCTLQRAIYLCFHYFIYQAFFIILRLLIQAILHLDPPSLF